MAERALPYAIRLAQARQSRLILMRAAIAPPPRTLDGSEWESDQTAAIAEAEEHLQEMAESVSGQVSRVETAAPCGRAAAEMLETVTRYAADGIVMATHGRTGLRHLLYGSVIEAVLANGTVRVFVVYARPGEEARPPFSPYTARACRPVARRFSLISYHRSSGVSCTGAPLSAPGAKSTGDATRSGRVTWQSKRGGEVRYDGRANPLPPSQAPPTQKPPR